MFGSASSRVIRASRRKRSSALWTSASGSSSLRATEPVSIRSRTRYTEDVAPRPSSPSTMKRLSIVVPRTIGLSRVSSVMPGPLISGIGMFTRVLSGSCL